MKILLIFPLLFASLICRSQLKIEPFIGGQTDLNGSGFKQLNTGVQLAFKKNEGYEFLLQLQKSWPFNNSSVDSAFTSNASLPLYMPADKSIRPAATSFAIGHRITVAGKKRADKFFVLIYTGLVYQKISVSYEYNKVDYIVLNPDKTLDRTGLYISAGVEYMRLLKKGRLFFQLTVASQPSGKNIDYPSTFNFLAPLAFNAGYSINLKNNSGEK